MAMLCLLKIALGRVATGQVVAEIHAAGERHTEGKSFKKANRPNGGTQRDWRERAGNEFNRKN